MDILGRVERIESELDALLYKAELWQLIFDESPFAMACFDQQLKFVLVNKEFCNLTGYSSEDIIGYDVKIVIPTNSRKLHAYEEKRFLSSPEKKLNRHGISPYLLKKNGGKILVNIELSFIYYKDYVYPIAFIRKV